MKPLLTSPHGCYQCGGKLRDAMTAAPLGIARSEATVACLDCGAKTSVYAILHRCDGCGALLESPARRAGQPHKCPRCGAGGEVPPGELLALDDPTLDEQHSFVVACPACARKWAALFGSVGQLAACPACHVAMTVPPFGESLPHTATSHLDALIRCRVCQQHIPMAAAACPICGARVHST